MVKIPALRKTTQLGKAFSPFMSVRTDATQRRGLRVARAIERKIDRAMFTIGGAVRRTAKKSIKAGGAVNRKHGKPGSPIISPRSKRTMFNTVEFDYNKTKMSLIVGFKKTGFRDPPGIRPSGQTARTVPNLLEYGGTIQASKPTIKPRQLVSNEWVSHYWKKEKRRKLNRRKKLGKSAKQMPLPKKRDIKFVVIPPGTRYVKARPTMRLAFNKVIKAKNIEKHLRNLRISDPSLLEKNIF